MSVVNRYFLADSTHRNMCMLYQLGIQQPIGQHFHFRNILAHYQRLLLRGSTPPSSKILLWWGEFVVFCNNVDAAR